MIPHPYSLYLGSDVLLMKLLSSELGDRVMHMIIFDFCISTPTPSVPAVPESPSTAGSDDSGVATCGAAAAVGAIVVAGAAGSADDTMVCAGSTCGKRSNRCRITGGVPPASGCCCIGVPVAG